MYIVYVCVSLSLSLYIYIYIHTDGLATSPSSEQGNSRMTFEAPPEP